MNRFTLSTRLPWTVLVASLVVAALLVGLLYRPADRFGEGPRKPELILYCAAGLIKPIEELARQYEAQFGVRVQIEPDASGKLLAKIKLAPEHGDLFLPAEDSFLALARRDGLVAESIPVTLLHPVIAVAAGNPKGVATPADLLRPDVRVALPNPELTAVGRTARAALSSSGVWAQLEAQLRNPQPRVALVGTVNDAAQTVKIGAADASILWDAVAQQYGLAKIEVPVLQQRPPEQASIAVLAQCRQPTRALHFARFVTSRDVGGPVFARYHFQPLPDADQWVDKPTVELFAGAMLRPAIAPALEAFQQREGVTLNVSYNGCGIVLSQIRAGARPAGYFACDTRFVDPVRNLFLDPVDVAANRLVMLVAKGNPRNLRDVSDLVQPGLKVGLAHPDKAALGTLTKLYLDQRGLTEPLVRSGNWAVESTTGDFLVNQLRARALDAVIVYRSNALSSPEGLARDYDVVELRDDVIAIQPFTILRDTPHRYLMQRLQERLVNATSQQQFESLGFRWLLGGASASAPARPATQPAP